MKSIDTNANKFFTDEVKTLSYAEYESLLQDNEIRDKVALKIMEKYEHFGDDNLQDLSHYIQKADKDLFLKLKDGVITLDQLKARIAERKTGLNYVVLDDLKEYINPKFFEGNTQEAKEKRKTLEEEAAKKKPPPTSSFKAVPRHGGERRRNYHDLPPSMKLDFHPKETTKKFEKKKLKKPGIKVPKNKEMIINLSDDEDSDDLKLKNPLRMKK